MQNDRQASIEKLFSDDQTVASIRIADYLDWAAHSDTVKYSRILAMPPIKLVVRVVSPDNYWSKQATRHTDFI